MPSLSSTLMGPLPIDELAAHKESIAIDIAIAVERHLNSDMETPVESPVELQQGHKITVDV